MTTLELTSTITCDSGKEVVMASPLLQEFEAIATRLRAALAYERELILKGSFDAAEWFHFRVQNQLRENLAEKGAEILEVPPREGENILDRTEAYQRAKLLLVYIRQITQANLELLEGALAATEPNPPSPHELN